MGKTVTKSKLEVGIVPFVKKIMTEKAMTRRWKGLKCSNCRHEFQIGDEVYYFRNKRRKEHLCEYAVFLTGFLEKGSHNRHKTSNIQLAKR